jgi:hypothetical protein
MQYAPRLRIKLISCNLHWVVTGLLRKRTHCIGRNSSHLIFGEQLGGRTLSRLILELGKRDLLAAAGGKLRVDMTGVQ